MQSKHEWCGARVGGPKRLILIQILKLYCSCMYNKLYPQIRRRRPSCNSAPKLTAAKSSPMNGDDLVGN